MPVNRERLSVKSAFLKSIYITLISVGLNFGFKIFLAKVMPKETLAIYFSVIDIFSLSLLILIGFRSSMVVSYSKTKDDFRILNIFRITVTLLILFSWGIILPYLKHSMNVDIHYWYLVSVIVAMGLSSYLSNQVAMYRLYRVLNHITILEPILVISWFLIAFYIADTSGLKPLFISTIMGSLTLSLYIYLKKRASFKEPPVKLIDLQDSTKEFIKNSIISTVEFGSGIVMMYIAVILIMNYFTISDLGNFQVVTKPILMYLIMLFVFPIFRFILPELSYLIQNREYQRVLNLKLWILKYSFIVSSSILILTLLFSRDVVTFLFPSEYINSYLMLIHLSFFFIFVILNAYQISFIKANSKFKLALLVRVSGVLIFVTSFFLIYYFSKSVNAVIVALSFGYVGMFFISLFFERRLLKELKGG